MQVYADVFQTSFRVWPHKGAAQLNSSSSSSSKLHTQPHVGCPCAKPRAPQTNTNRLQDGNTLLDQSARLAAAVSSVGVMLQTGAASAAEAAGDSAVAAAAAVVPVDPSTYVPGPAEVGWQIWFAAIVSTIPFVIGSYEFGKRILIQRRCQVCGGSGLVQRGNFQRKCPECGGFFPWISWQMFLSANARPGNGGPLLQPRGQTSVLYTVPPPANSMASQQKQPTGSSGFRLPMPEHQQQQQQQQEERGEDHLG